jgi:tetratricopeptide (TPR) repeat protein
VDGRLHEVAEYAGSREEDAMHLHRLAAAAAIATAFVSTEAQAAVSVLGAGPAQLCFEAADSGNAPGENLIYCNAALGGLLIPVDRAATYVNRGVLKLALNKPDEAADDFNAGLAIKNDIGEAYVDLGASQIMNKRYAEAIDNITKGLALGTKQPQNAYFDRAMANEALGNYKAAYEDYRQALAVAPGFELAARQLKRFKVVEKPGGT